MDTGRMRMDIDPKHAKQLASLTDGLSGTIIENPNVGVTRATCPRCPHVINVVGMGFAAEAPDQDDRAVIMCGGCYTFLFITPPGFTLITDAEFSKLPYETRTLLERTRTLAREARRLTT
jgi:hypothetical protein